MFTAIVLMCSIAAPGVYGCGPRSNLGQEIIGKYETEAQCIKEGNKALRAKEDTDEIVYRAICVR